MSGNLGNKAIHWAAKWENTRQSLVASGVDVNVVNKVGETALHVAAREGKRQAIATLCEVGANINATDDMLRTPAHLAASTGKYFTLFELGQRGANLNKKDVKGRSVIHWAAKAENATRILRYLAAEGVNINEVDEEGNTPLMTAAAAGAAINIRTLIALRATQAKVNFKGCSALHIAARENRCNAVRELVKICVDQPTTCAPGATTVILAVSKREESLEIIATLLEAGSDAKQPDHGGYTALHRAALVGNVEVIKLLLSAGAEVNCSNDDGETPIHKAAFLEEIEAVKVLLQRGADGSIQNNLSETPAHKALFYTEILEELASNRNALDKQDYVGNTVLHIATQKEIIEAVVILLRKGANPFVTNNDGHTPRNWLRFHNIDNWRISTALEDAESTWITEHPDQVIPPDPADLGIEEIYEHYLNNFL